MQGVMEEVSRGERQLAPGQKKTTRKSRQPIVPPAAEAPNPKRLTEEQSYLAGEYWERAMKVARAHKKKHPSLNLDWEGAAAIGLCDAAASFDPKRGTQFWTLAYRRVAGALIDLMRSERIKGYGRNWDFEGKPDIYSMDGVFIDHQESHRKFSYHDILPSDELEIGWELRSIEGVERIARGLPWLHREAMILLYCYGFNMAKVGRVLGVSESRVSQIHSQAIELLRESIRPAALAS